MRENRFLSQIQLTAELRDLSEIKGSESPSLYLHDLLECGCLQEQEAAVMLNLWGHKGEKAQLPSCWGVPTPSAQKTLLLQQRHETFLARPALAAHRTKQQHQLWFANQAWQTSRWRSTIHFLWLVSRFVQREEPKLGDRKGIDSWIPKSFSWTASKGQCT